ncbi:MAG TPA: phosphoribosyltransferase family protein, partial [Thermomicrobiales bacterium]|nr:phosphoribosyltransferase family protein [Thermomicrobiales bacterium]
WVCAECLAATRPFDLPACLRCGAIEIASCECDVLPDVLQSIRAAYPFAGWVRESIHDFKFRREFGRCDYLAQTIVDHVPLAGIDLLVPVPIHRERLRERGFNQSMLLARAISKQTGIPAQANAIERTVKRLPQVGRSMQDRWLAVAGVFAIPHPDLVRARHIAIVDDVITTGATVTECARVLIAAGAASVRAIAIARG